MRVSLKKIDLIAVAVISKGIEWASIELSKVLKNNIPILILTKGLSINNNDYEILAHKMERILKKNGVKDTNISGVGGPCIAKALAERSHTSVVFANPDEYPTAVLLAPVVFQYNASLPRAVL